jgi:hypothetical protein
MAETAPSTRSVNVFEYAGSQAPHSVDRQAGVIRGVKVLGLRSMNGPQYDPTALDQGARLYEGASVYLNHNLGVKPGQSRPLNEKFGVLASVARRTDGLYGDLHYIKSHPVAEQVCEMAERFPHKFGLSHAANCDLDTRAGIYRKINAVRSVDLVDVPATTNGIFESFNSSVNTGKEVVSPVSSMFDMFVAKAREIFNSKGTSAEKAAKVTKAFRLVAKADSDLQDDSDDADTLELPGTGGKAGDGSPKSGVAMAHESVHAGRARRCEFAYADAVVARRSGRDPFDPRPIHVAPSAVDVVESDNSTSKRRGRYDAVELASGVISRSDSGRFVDADQIASTGPRHN